MKSKTKATVVLVTQLVLSMLVMSHAHLSERRYLCEDACGYIRYDSFLGLVFLMLLFTASVSFVRLMTSDTAFRAWKRFMIFFVPAGTVFALPAFMGGGGAWAIGSGPDSEVTMWLLGIVYTLGSIGIIAWYAVRERQKQKQRRDDGVEGGEL